MVRLASTTVAFALLAHLALASDGVLEINQACVAVGCFAGDTAGFPVSIGTPGSYRLTSNLSPAPSPNVNAIEISSRIVTLDLNGFAIIGPTSFSGGASGTCGAPGTGIGIIAMGSADAVSVSNGVVRGMNSHGVIVLNNSRVENVIAEGNCGSGIVANIGSLVLQSVARRNGSQGIALATASRVRDSVADFNAANGIYSGVGDVVVESCTATANGGDGINVGVRSLVRGSIANSNTRDGIAAVGPSLILDNVFSANGRFGITGNSGVDFESVGVAQNVGRGNITLPNFNGAFTYLGCNYGPPFPDPCP